MKRVCVTIDRPLGSVHPKYPNVVYTVNYGYVLGVVGGDGCWQDAYVLGVDKPLDNFVGNLVSVIHRKNDIETKWIVAPDGQSFTTEQILEATNFVERFFDITVEMV